MPTGYTHDVATGEVTELEPFILTVARGMGALIAMRDLPWDAEIPEKFPYSDYYEKELDKHEAECDRLNELTLEQAAAEQELEIAAAIDYKEKYQADMHQKERRYVDMIEKVKAWTGAPEGIKEFALSQLEDSRKFDCSFNYVPSVPTKIDPSVWLASKKADAYRDLVRAQTSLQEEIARVDGRNEWLAQLRESLK